MTIITGVPTIEHNIEYDRRYGQSLTLDAFIPVGGGANRPALVLVHGGAWSQLDKRVWYGEASRFATEGFVSFCINYRMTNGMLALPSQIENVRTAIRFIRANAARFGIDANRVSTFGGSAGGHLASLAAYQPDPLQPEARIRCTVIWSGFFQLVNNFNHRRKPMGGLSAVEVAIGGTPDEYPEKYQRFSPINYVDVSPVPSFLCVSTDEISPQHDTEALAEKLKAMGVPCELIVLEGNAHTRQYSPFVIEQSVKFLKAHG